MEQLANTVTGGVGSDGKSNGSADGGAVYSLAFGSDIDRGHAVAASLVLNNSILATTRGGNDLVSRVVVHVNPAGSNTATVGGSHNLVMSSGGTIGAGVITLAADPDLGLLQHNGGPTPTMLPLAGSPVLGAGTAGLAPATDQRGRSRSPNGPADLGAVQVSVAPTGGAGGSSPSPSPSPSPASPPELHKPFLLALLDEFFKGVEAVNGNGTETVTDNLFGFPLVSTYDGAGDLVNVTLLGFNITALFE